MRFHFFTTCLGVALLLLVPSALYAQTLFDFFNELSFALSRVFLVLGFFALAAFFWGMVKFIANAGSPEGRAQGRRVMVWGIITLVIFFSIWTIIGVLNAMTETTSGGSCPPPSIQAGGVTSC